MNKIVIGIIVVVLVAGAFFAGKMLNGGDSETEKKEEVSTSTTAITSAENYFAMKRFIISISDEKSARYLVLDLSLGMPSGEKELIGIESYTPLLRNELVKRFVNLERDDVKSEFSDIEKIQQSLLVKFNEVLKLKSNIELSSVLITNVFIQ